ncbi:Metallo-hydrolase/oxidoreductase superfamily protein [Hordeum vulgare]|nr:Metallo-hydrolase/oxidoreductase superfamily protein [Hordeum vulgare]
MFVLGPVLSVILSSDKEGGRGKHLLASQRREKTRQGRRKSRPCVADGPSPPSRRGRGRAGHRLRLPVQLRQVPRTRKRAQEGKGALMRSASEPALWWHDARVHPAQPRSPSSPPPPLDRPHTCHDVYLQSTSKTCNDLKYITHKYHYMKMIPTDLTLLNTSLLVDYCQDGTHKYILIDIGKTFREQVLRWFCAVQIILTHEHADDVLGLDEVWVVQPRNGRNDVEQIPIFLTQFTMDSIARRFPYLVEQKPEDGNEDAQAAKIDSKIIEEDVDKPFVASGLELVTLPVTTSAVERYFDLVTCLTPRVLTYLATLCSAASEHEKVSGGALVDGLEEILTDGHRR